MCFDDDINLPDSEEDLLKMLETLGKEAMEDLSMSVEEYEAKYGESPLTPAKSKPMMTKVRKPAKSGLAVPAYDIHTFDMHWILYHLDFFRDGISLKEYVRRARRDGSDITMKWYNYVEKYRFTEEGIKRMGRQELGYKGRQMLEQLDMYVDSFQRNIEKREQQLAGMWKPQYEWEKPIEGDSPEQLKADQKLFKKFQEQYAIINDYYPELPDIASSMYVENVLKQNELDFPDVAWRKMYHKFEDADIDYDTPIRQLVKIGLISKELAADCKPYKITRAIDLLINTPLQYHALVEEIGTDHPDIINPKMDAADAKSERIGTNYDAFSLAHLNFVRAVIADNLWSF